MYDSLDSWLRDTSGRDRGAMGVSPIPPLREAAPHVNLYDAIFLQAAVQVGHQRDHLASGLPGEAVSVVREVLSGC